MSSLGSRLGWAIKGAGLSVAAFHREMSNREVKGASYAMVHRYLRGKREPPLAFLRSASDRLGVREEWLVFGKGPRYRPGEDDLNTKLADRAYLIHKMGDPGLESLFRSVLFRLLKSCPDGGEATDDQTVELGAMIENLILHPLMLSSAFPIDWDMWTVPKLRSFLFASLFAADLAIPEPGEGKSTVDGLLERFRIFGVKGEHAE